MREPRVAEVGGRQSGEVAAELPVASRHQQGEFWHVRQLLTSAARRFSGSHQARLSRYQAIVPARPSSKGTFGA